MPLVKRKVQPIYLSRRPCSWGVTETGEEVKFEGDYDLAAVANISLCGALHQLASLVLIADEIANDLEDELSKLISRTQDLTTRFVELEGKVLSHNPRTVTVPESDLKSFSERKNNYENDSTSSEMLFTPEMRPLEIQKLCEEAAEGPIRVIREIDRFRDDGIRSSKYYKCTPIIGDSLRKEKLKKLNLDIETRRPASFVALREWCSDDETLLSEVELAPVSPATPLRPPPPPHPSDQKLPLPEQRLLAFSCKYPPQLIPIDVSGRGFRRMELFRQSLVQFEYVKNKRRRRRLKRRNTIADAREARSALKHSNLPSTSSGQGRSSPRSGSPSSRGGISSYTDPSFDTTIDTSSTKTSSEREVRHHIFGLDISIPTPPRNVHTLSRHLVRDCNSFRDDIMSQNTCDTMLDESVLHSSSPRDFRKKGGKKKALNVSYDILPENIVLNGRCGKRGNSIGNVASPKSILPISTPSAPMNLAVKLREGNSRDEGTRSSSGNWSGSSSTRTSLESDIQQQQNHVQFQNSIHLATKEEVSSEEDEEVLQNNTEEIIPSKVSAKLEVIPFQTAISPSSSFEQDSFISDTYQVRSASPSSNHRTNSRTTDDFPSSSSQASDGTLTPTQDIQDIPFFDDDTGSAFSCDTEGYYTSFHIDSGLRSVSFEDTKLASESEADLFGRGSTGTTNSSASLGTVIMRNPDKKTPPKPPQRVSSLERKDNRESIITVIHVNGSTSSSREDVAGAEGSEKGACRDGRDSRSSKECDSGRETSSSPTESMSPRQPSLFSPEPDLESDIETAERKDNFRLKTTISTSGIPSMCVITPPQSDDESIRSVQLNSKSGSPISGTKVDSNVKRKIQSFQTTTSLPPPPATAVRQPGDGAVAPPVPPSSSPSFAAQSIQGGGYAPSLTVMSQKRVESGSQFKNFLTQSETPTSTSPKPPGDHLSLGRSVSERRAEIQLKVLGDKKPSSDVLLQKPTQKEADISEATNLISYKELPTMASAVSHPFSAVPSSVKQSVVITPTNSLERRKAHTKSGAHVTLDSEGKVVYSSDSLPRRKGHTSFEPGPYIKPPPISGANGSQPRPKVSGSPSSIQSMPLPPVPGRESSIAGARPSDSSSLHTKPSSIPNDAQSHATSTPQQPKLGTRSQISAISQTLSGLSAHIQPRTISQINSMRSANVKSPKTVPSLDGPKVSSEEDSVVSVSVEKKHYEQSESDLSSSSTHYQYKMQSQLADQMDSRTKETNSSTLPHKRASTLGKESSDQQMDAHSNDIERLQYYSLQRQPSSQQGAQTSQIQQYQALLLQQQKLQAAQAAQQQQQQLKLQQDHHQQLLQQMPQQPQQTQSKHHILQQQHIQLQQQLEQQQQQLQQHKALKESQARAEAQAIYQAKKDALAKQDAQSLLAPADNLYQRQDLQRQQLLQLQQQQMAAYQQPYYQTQEELYMARQNMMQQAQQSRSQNAEVIMATQGAPMSPQSQRGVYIHVQNQLSQDQMQPTSTVGQTDSSFPVRPQSTPVYHVGATSRAPTPIQGLSISSPQRLPTNSSANSLQHQSLRTHPGMMYGSQRSLQNMGLSTDGRGTPIPRPMSASPPPYEQYNLTNSDIYGRIGMTRQVQVGVVLPAGFGRNQRNYSSLPPNLRHPLTPSEVLAQQQQGRILRQTHASGKTLTRRASVAGTETSNVKSAASNPSTPEKALEKKEKGSKREKDKEKEREKKKKEAKTEKSPKKKWFWTLPLRRKKKNKDDSSEDDDGGFKDATQKTTRKVVPNEEDTSFIRYPSPDTGSSDLNSSYSSDLSSGEHGYRSSPSSEVYYYSQRAQTLQHQAAAVRSASLTGSMGVIPGATPIPTMGMPIPRSQPTTPVSPPDSQGIMTVDGTDITDLSRSRRYMSRDEMYAAMRHPQYYNNRNAMPGLPSDFSQNSTPTSSRSSSPAIFGVNPPQSYVIRPQVREGYQSLPNEQMGISPSSRATQSSEISQTSSQNFKTNENEDSSSEIEPPAGYREIISSSSSPTDSQEETSSGSYMSAQSVANRVVAKQTTLMDFKKMILEKSMNSAGGKERVSAVEMLRASRPSIYGYSLPPAPVVIKSQDQQMTPKGEGVIMPPNSRNTARALLFQSRFGSGRRFRSPKTEIISTTIVEDHLEEEESRLYEEYEEESSEEDISSSTTSSQERHSVRSVVCVPVAKAEPASQKSENGKQLLDRSKQDNNFYTSRVSSSNGLSEPATQGVAHSTPNKANAPPPQEPNLSIITANDVYECTHQEGCPKSPEKEAVETAL